MRDTQTVVVRLSQDDPLGEAMMRLRTWLDMAKIQPAEFKTLVDVKGYAFTIGFLSVGDADQFRAQFGTRLLGS
jgi:hypothetical protein